MDRASSYGSAVTLGLGQDRSSTNPLTELYWLDQPEVHRAYDAGQIETWLDDEEQLAELGRRAVKVMLGYHPKVEVPSGMPLDLLLRELLARDWLQV